MDKKSLIERIALLKTYFEKGFIPKVENHEANPSLDKGSRENYLYFTLPVALNFQRNSPALWQSAYKTWEDIDTNYLFYPEKVTQFSIEKVKTDLKKHKIALQENKHTHIWYTLCQSFHKNFENDPRNFIKLNESCVEQVINYLRDNSKSFPYLSWPKLSHYWLFILSHYTDIQLQNAHMLSIIPDTHIQQASLKLWVTDLEDTPEVVSQKWFELLKWTDLSTTELHSILWNWSRNNFDPQL